MQNDLNLYIVLQKPPAGIDFGLQKGSGAVYETVQTQRSGGHDLHFSLTVTVKENKQSDITPAFAGPFVHGSHPDKFIYIDIGTYAGQDSPIGGRIKIPLTGITRDIIEQANTNSGLETSILGTGKNGGPAYATVKPFAGWKVKMS